MYDRLQRRARPATPAKAPSRARRAARRIQAGRSATKPRQSGVGVRQAVRARRRRRAQAVRQARIAGAVPQDAAHPPLRGELRRAVRLRQDRRLPAPVHRRGSGGRRRDPRAAQPGPPDHALPRPRLRAGHRRRSRRGHGRAVRQGDRHDARPRRLDAHVARRAAFLGRLRHRRRPPADRHWPRSGAGLSGDRRGASMCIFGDGSTNAGAFHEALNMAKSGIRRSSSCARTTCTPWALPTSTSPPCRRWRPRPPLTTSRPRSSTARTCWRCTRRRSAPWRIARRARVPISWRR